MYYINIRPMVRTNKRFSLLIFILPFLYANYLPAVEFAFNGQATGWVGYSEEWQMGVRYIPALRILHPMKQGRIDGEVLLNSSTHAPLGSPLDIVDNIDIDIYRLWARYSTPQFGLRLGLQKINFGSAKVLRSLMWFDQIDVRDPLKLTGGVYALLGRYYFLNNVNVWVWGLYGNHDLKGLEMFKTDEDHIEFGGRYQLPIPRGEIAFSIDRRHIDRKDWEKKKMAIPITNGSENRYAIDGSWDVEVGLWFEAYVSETKITNGESLWQESLTVGWDYTLGIGPGIHLLCEHLICSSGSEITDFDTTQNFSALLVDFSINMLDRFTAIGYYDWEEKKVYAYIGLQRTYDNWQINLIAFSSKKNSSNTFKGKGVQCMVTYNH